MELGHLLPVWAALDEPNKDLIVSSLTCQSTFNYFRSMLSFFSFLEILEVLLIEN